MLSTRKARREDEDRVVELLRQLLLDQRDDAPVWRPAFRQLLENDRGLAIVAEDETGIWGVITLSFNWAVRYGGEYAQIEELVVDEAARGKKAGAALVKAAIRAATDRGAAEIGLFARPANQPFYEKYGFTYVGPELRLPLAHGPQI